MCGKFTQMFTWAEVHAFSQPLVIKAEGDQVVTSTPMRMAHIMRLDETGARVMNPMRWGFSKKSAKAPVRPDHMHARAETVDTLPTFAPAFAASRGVLMVHTFNEGEELPNGRTKQWVITPKDGEPIAIAVICERWTNETEDLWTFVQVTTPANTLIRPITDRMPAILRRADLPVWLGEIDAPAAAIKALLATYEDDGAWDIAPQASGKPPRPAGGGAQADLF
ncbi:MAG: SOS response-associated peptidase family protein [Hyphomonadaceae bacterium]|nr:SOS response-associated peptidase family protein [Hyphomonadaceae bacterium]